MHRMALGPLFIIMGGGMAFVAAYGVRLATRSPEVQWTRNPESFNWWKDKNARMLNVGPLPSDHDHSSDRRSRAVPADHAKLGAVKPDYRK